MRSESISGLSSMSMHVRMWMYEFVRVSADLMVIVSPSWWTMSCFSA